MYINCILNTNYFLAGDGWILTGDSFFMESLKSKDR
jgi:hypothetical protein